jgi:chromosome partitioning protein
MQCEFYALDGLAQLLNTISIVKESLNPNITIEGVLITMFDARTNLTRQVVQEIKNKFQDKVYNTIIPRNVRLSEAPSFGQPVNIYDKHSRGALAYEQLAEEILAGNGIKTEGRR